MMKKPFLCFVCGTELDKENSSEEHILLNALGGHLHSPALLCKKCNSDIGSKADEALASALNYAASYLNIPRQRGENQIIRTNPGETYHLRPGGKPELKHPDIKMELSEHAGTIEITARDVAESGCRGVSNKYIHPLCVER